ncbi:MAG: hypothetical protein HYY37_01970 [Candidatus Aenigmarchaeota archaeon]|nr:hypothetical protein [Candidatus Aenigmarchaeota archaeon]
MMAKIPDEMLATFRKLPSETSVGVMVARARAEATHYSLFGNYRSLQAAYDMIQRAYAMASDAEKRASGIEDVQRDIESLYHEAFGR